MCARKKKTANAVKYVRVTQSQGIRKQNKIQL